MIYPQKSANETKRLDALGWLSNSSTLPKKEEMICKTSF